MHRNPNPTPNQLAGRRYYMAHKEECKKRTLAWRKKHSKKWCKYMRARMRKHYQENPEEWKAYCKKNKERIKGYQKTWRTKNRKRLRLSSRKRYARLKELRELNALTFEI